MNEFPEGERRVTQRRSRARAARTTRVPRGALLVCDGGKRYPYSSLKMGSGQLECG